MTSSKRFVNGTEKNTFQTVCLGDGGWTRKPALRHVPDYSSTTCIRYIYVYRVCDCILIILVTRNCCCTHCGSVGTAHRTHRHYLKTCSAFTPTAVVYRKDVRGAPCSYIMIHRCKVHCYYNIIIYLYSFVWWANRLHVTIRYLYTC